MACAALAMAGAPSALADAGPFACTVGTDFISPRGQLVAMQDTNSGPPGAPTPLGSSPFTYNALAFDRNNGYIYAIGEPPHSPDLLRFDNTGTVTDLGPVSGLPEPDDRQYVVGAFDNAGNYWVLAESDPGTAYKVDVNSNSVIQTLTLSAPFRGFDWTYDYGYMWGLDDKHLSQVDLNTGQVLSQPVASLANGANLNQQFNAVWTFANGDIGFLSATNPVMERAAVNPGPFTSPSNVTSIQEFPFGPSAGVNDGTSCQPPDDPIVLSPETFHGTEGDNSTDNVATFTDPDSSAQAGDYSAWINWGDGLSSAGTVSGPTGGPFTVNGTHSYAEEGSYAIQVTVSDIDNSGNQAVTHPKAQVADAALNGSCAAPTTSTQSFNGSTATFTDADPSGTTSDYSATIDWGDNSQSQGTVSGGSGSGPYTASGTHNYATTGTYTITTAINDAGGSKTSAACKTVVYAFAPGGGSFAIGDQNSANGSQVTFWGAQWWTLNSLSGGTAPSAFKGFAKNPSTPACNVNWSTDPGNSAPPPSGPLPGDLAVIVTSHTTKSGAQISGDTPHIVVVKTNAGYEPNSGHAGTGTVEAQVC